MTPGVRNAFCSWRKGTARLRSSRACLTRRFLVRLSKPTPTEPIPKVVVDIHLTVDSADPTDVSKMHYSIEQEAMVRQPGVQHACVPALLTWLAAAEPRRGFRWGLNPSHHQRRVVVRPHREDQAGFHGPVVPNAREVRQRRHR